MKMRELLPPKVGPFTLSLKNGEGTGSLGVRRCKLWIRSLHNIVMSTERK